MKEPTAVRGHSDGLFYEDEMYTETYLKEKLKSLYEKNPYIHIHISLLKPHVELSSVCVKLVGVYRHIFQIEIEQREKTERYSIQYGDIASGIVKIDEL